MVFEAGFSNSFPWLRELSGKFRFVTAPFASTRQLADKAIRFVILGDHDHVAIGKVRRIIRVASKPSMRGMLMSSG